MHRLTGKQCRAARALLKWNIYDLASRMSGIDPRRVESFERGMVHIAEWENDEMVTTFRKEGIVFNDVMDVTLVPKDKEIHAPITKGDREGAHISLDADQTILSDSTATAAGNAPEDEGGEE